METCNAEICWVVNVEDGLCKSRLVLSWLVKLDNVTSSSQMKMISRFHIDIGG